MRQQFLSVEEALSTHCIPVTPEAAKASSSPQLDISHVAHGEGVKMAWNAMSLPCVGAMLLCAVIGLTK